MLQVGDSRIEHTGGFLADLPVLRLGVAGGVGDVVRGSQLVVDLKVALVELLVEAPDDGLIFL
jgi:hypothetical protein